MAKRSEVRFAVTTTTFTHLAPVGPMVLRAAPNKLPRSRRVGPSLRTSPVTALALLVAALVALSSLSAGLAGARGQQNSAERLGVWASGSNFPAARQPPTAGGAERGAASVLNGVISTIDLVDNTTLPGATPPAFQDDPESIVFDPGNGDFYVRGGLGTAVNVVNATTFRVLDTIGISASQNAYSLAPTIVVDPANGDLYAMNYNTGNISVIAGTTNEIVGSIGSGISPVSGVFDPSNGYLYVSEWTSSRVAVINGANDRFVTNVSVGTDPTALLFDPTSSEVFVTNYGSANVSVIDTTSDTLVKTIATGTAATHPQTLALDTDDNDVDVGSETTYNISVISASSLTLVAHPHVSYDSDGLAYAPRQDELFVENGGEGNITVFNQSESDRVVANITTGSAPEGIAYDPVDQEVYALNSEASNATVINPATNHIVGSVSTDDGYDYAVAIDSSNGNVFVASEGTYTGSIRGYQANVTVVQVPSNKPIASIPLEVFPEGLTYDPGNGELVASDVGGQDVYFLNTSSGRIEGTSPTGYAWSSVYDSLTHDLWVYNFGSYNITVLNSALRPVANLTLGSYPLGIAFDSANGDIYVPDGSAGDVWVFDGATNAFDTTIPVTPGADLNAVLYDPHNQEVYVSDQTGRNLTIINGTSQRTVGSVPTGTSTLSLAFDSDNDTIWAANSGNFTVIRDATNRTVANVPYTYASGLLAYDGANNVLYDAGNFESIVSGIGASNYTALGTIYLGENYYTSGIAYDPADQDIYVSTADNGMVSVIGPPTSYPVQFQETGLPQGTLWNVTLAGVEKPSNTPTISFSELPGHYSFTVGDVTGYVANVTSGSVTVTDQGETVDIGFSPVASSYEVTFQERGLPTSTLWNVTLDGVQNHSTTSTVGFVEPGGATYPFSVGVVNGYVANNSSGTVRVVSSPVTVDIGFTPLHSTFPVTFLETGLSSQTTWSVTFNHTANSSSTNSIGFRDANGTWPFTVSAVAGYDANVTSGNVTIHGLPREVFVGFSAVRTYPVNFTETGLPSSTPWSVTLAGVPEQSSANTISFAEPNGVYPFTVGAVSGYSASPNSGAVNVSGAAVHQPILFTAGVLALTVALTVQPSSIVLGNSTTLTTTTSGGTPPFSYDYTGLPTGCTTKNSSSWVCTPTATGSLSIEVTVTDQSGGDANASASLKVSSTSSPSSPSNNSSNAAL
ncbi:MAG TPA: YncE family protein, partial [Thermoplasmata archaeon]|nr:YncE family protein [Thermoplasmata archaeon]